MMCFAHSVDWLPWLGVVGKVDVEKNGSHDKKHPIKPICFQLLVSKCVCELDEKQQRNLTIFLFGIRHRKIDTKSTAKHKYIY